MKILFKEKWIIWNKRITIKHLISYLRCMKQLNGKYLFLIQIDDFKLHNLSFDKIDKNPSKLNNKINELKNKFEKAKQVLNNMNGIQMSYIEQQEYYNSLLKQHEIKLQLLDKYKSTCKFDTAEIQQDDILIKNDVYTNLNSENNLNQGDVSTAIDDEQSFETDIKSDDIDMVDYNC